MTRLIPALKKSCDNLSEGIFGVIGGGVTGVTATFGSKKLEKLIFKCNCLIDYF